MKLNDELHHQQIGALYQGYGVHYVNIWVGKPVPQRQTVIVNSGSSVTFFHDQDVRITGIIL
eukprot:10984231-Ditylum_brightwellii.AAC.1